MLQIIFLTILATVLIRGFFIPTISKGRLSWDWNYRKRKARKSVVNNTKKEEL